MSKLGSLVGALSLCGVTACSNSPAVKPNGLPAVVRYTNPTQVDWALGAYAAASARAGGTELLDESCLGIERMLFDLESGLHYPVILRLSTESANLSRAWSSLPALVQRHPFPAACAELHGGSAPGAVPVSVPAAAPSPEPERQAAASSASASAPAPVATGDVAGVAAAAAQVAAAPPPAPSAESPSESAYRKERRELARLRAALGMAPVGSNAESAATSARRVDYAALTELSRSSLPIIKLRARFHLLGLCTLAVEAADEFLSPSTSPRDVAPANADPVAEGMTPRCVGAEVLDGSPGSAITVRPRVAQRALMKAMLKAWRMKYAEPMTDLVVALANFASRDNPVVDGPRVAR